MLERKRSARAIARHAACAVLLSASAHAVDYDPKLEPPRPPGYVQVFARSKLTGFGVVLRNDGRVLTALSSLGTESTVEIQQPSGVRSRAKKVFEDASLDLALLAPLSKRSRDGIEPVDEGTLPESAGNLAMLELDPAQRVSVRWLGSLAAGSAFSRDGKTNLRVYPPPQNMTPLPGTPLVSDRNKIVGMAVSLCANEKLPCAARPVFVPVLLLKRFTARAPSSADVPEAWIGVAVEAERGTSGVRVTAVAPGSPAEKAEIRPVQDRIVAVDSLAVDSADSLRTRLTEHEVGDSAELLVFSQGRYRSIKLKLSAGPPSPR